MRILTIALIAGLVVSCSGRKNQDNEGIHPGNIRISGQLANGEDVLVTLDYMGATAFQAIDSVRCDKHGKFEFETKTSSVNYYALKYTEHGYVTIIAHPGDEIAITGNADSIYPYQVDGSADSRLVRDLGREHKKTLDQLREISGISRKIMGRSDYSIKKQALNREFDSIAHSFYHYSKNFITNNPESPSILIALYNQFGPGLPVFDPSTDLDIYRFTDSVLYEQYPENEAVKALHSELHTALEQISNLQKKSHLNPGEKAPDFVMETIRGKMVSLSDLRGKIVLLQFWASWSAPSVNENGFLEDVFKKYGRSDLQIIQVSLDNNLEDWQSAIKKNIPGWYHVCDLHRWESPVVNLYNVQRIPANFLINKAGYIVETDIFGKNLEETLLRYIK
ncbi:MAG: redoxin domain-containing protein [Bacteroidales bacterium]|nr:redoxin domain-containing protein [Bacteroidales bacterium]